MIEYEVEGFNPESVIVPSLKPHKLGFVDAAIVNTGEGFTKTLAVVVLVQPALLVPVIV